MGKPGTRWGKACTGLERRTRVAHAERLLCESLGDPKPVYDALQQEYGVSRKEAGGYIRQVYRLWRKRSEHTPDEWRALLSGIVGRVAQEAMADGDRRDTLSAVKVLAKMHGAEAPRSHVVHADMRPVIDVTPERLEAAKARLRLLKAGGSDDE